jgi:hypothetical protein
MLGTVDDQRVVDRLPALRCAGASRQHMGTVVTGERDGAFSFRQSAGDHHAQRHHLIGRRVGGVAAAVEAVE